MGENIKDQKILKIKIGEEYKAKVEKIEEFEKSMFKDVYDKAFDCIGAILAETLNNNNNNTNKENYEKYNNIVTFIGERGTGKTSAMLSVSGALKDEYSNQYDQFSYKNLKDKNLKHKTFNDIGVIDPSHFDENSNILEIILAKMFKKFKMQIEESKNRETNHDKKRNLIKAFEEVFENLKTIQYPESVYKGEALDALLKMSASTNLKSNMTNLVKEYLNFFNDSNNAILLLEIDDIDLSTKHAYEMVEQIRKYLIIPNVVILMAVKMQQLSHIIERNMRKEFEIMLEKSHMNDEEPKNMAEKYLMKLIPLERRLFLPNFDNINLDMIMEIKNKKNSIEKSIRKNIYDKTGMMFFNTTTQISYIVPRNLREIVNLVSKLEKMPMLEDIPNRREIKTKNFYEIREYFLNHWVEENLTEKQKEIIKEINKRDVDEKNKYTVRILDKIYFKDFTEGEHLNKLYTEAKKFNEYTKIINFLNQNSNISIGDILVVLNLIDNVILDEQDKKFIFAIKTIYSIILYGFIRDMKSATGDINKLSSKYKKIINGYIRNISFHKILKEQTRIISDNDYYKNHEVKKWLDYFIIWRGSKKHNGKEENYRLEESRIRYKDDDIKGKNLEFDYLGFLFNGIEESIKIKNTLYIGSLEFLERILEFKPKLSKDLSFYYKIEEIINQLNDYIEKNIQKPNGFTSTDIKNNDFLKKNLALNDEDNNDLKKEILKVFPDIYTTYDEFKDSIKFNKILKEKNKLIKDVDTIKNKLGKIENKEKVLESLENFKKKITNDKYDNLYKDLLENEMKYEVAKELEEHEAVEEYELKINELKENIRINELKTEIDKSEEAIEIISKLLEIEDYMSEATSFEMLKTDRLSEVLTIVDSMDKNIKIIDKFEKILEGIEELEILKDKLNKIFTRLKN